MVNLHTPATDEAFGLLIETGKSYAEHYKQIKGILNAALEQKAEQGYAENRLDVVADDHLKPDELPTFMRGNFSVTFDGLLQGFCDVGGNHCVHLLIEFDEMAKQDPALDILCNDSCIDVFTSAADGTKDDVGSIDYRKEAMDFYIDKMEKLAEQEGQYSFIALLDDFRKDTKRVSEAYKSFAAAVEPLRPSAFKNDV